MQEGGREGGGESGQQRKDGKPPPSTPCRLLPSQLRDGVLRSPANCHGGPAHSSGGREIMKSRNRFVRPARDAPG